MTLYNNTYLNDLAQRAYTDPQALAELGGIASKQARAINQRLRRLEAAGKTGDAYKRILDSIPGGGRRFSQAKTGAVDGLFKNIMETQAALRQKESTLSGIREVDRKTVEEIFRHPKIGLMQYDEKGREIRLTDQQINNFNKFLESKSWPAIHRSYGSDALRVISEMVLNDDNISDVLNSYEEWRTAEYESDKEREIALNELNERWFGF